MQSHKTSTILQDFERINRVYHRRTSTSTGICEPLTHKKSVSLLQSCRVPENFFKTPLQKDGREGLRRLVKTPRSLGGALYSIQKQLIKNFVLLGSSFGFKKNGYCVASRSTVYTRFFFMLTKIFPDKNQFFKILQKTFIPIVKHEVNIINLTKVGPLVKTKVCLLTVGTKSWSPLIDT